MKTEILLGSVSRFLGGGAVVTRKSLVSSKLVSFVLSALIAVIAVMIFMSFFTIDFRRRMTHVVSSRGVYVM